ncbi:hypothetical protein GCK32_012691 [Trichostrongylus colubriformis]|uniref:Uncharacterized protein n=1 Tax=Trichostrongylus colubriformis TaxID=6319 RepID=A0AAN8IKQ0_TRICO
MGLQIKGGHVDIGTNEDCTMKMALNDPDKTCKALVGDVEYKPQDKANKEVWSRIKKVYGTVTVDALTESSLGILKNITIYGWARRSLKIINNRILKHIDEILTIEIKGSRPQFDNYYFRNNSGFCHPINIMKKINAKVKRTLWHDRKCLIKCKGGKVDLKYLQQFDKFCDEIDGDLIIEGLQGKYKISCITIVHAMIESRISCTWNLFPFRKTCPITYKT